MIYAFLSATPPFTKNYHMHLKGFKSQRYGSRTASYPWLCKSSYTNLVGWPSPQRCTSYSYSVVLILYVNFSWSLGQVVYFLGLCGNCPLQSASLVANLAEAFLSAYLLKFSTSIIKSLHFDFAWEIKRALGTKSIPTTCRNINL